MTEPTISACLERSASSSRGLRFIDRREKETFFSYEQIYRRARRVAAGLAEKGIEPGDRVAIVALTSIGFFDAFYGVLLAGAAPVPLYPPVRLGLLDEYHARTSNMLQACGARMLLTGGRVRLLLGRTIRRASLELGAQAIEKLPQAAPKPVDASPDDLALIQFSSGTVTAPKPVRLTHRRILANVDVIRTAILAAYPEGPALGHLAVSWLPLYHDMGLIGSVFTALAHPSDLVLIPPELFVARPSIWLRTISRYGATVSAAPNFAYSLCADRIGDVEMEGVDLSSWRLAMNGGEPITPSVLDRFSRRFRSFGFREEALTPVYGLAEAALAVTFSDPLARYLCRSFDRERLAADGVAQPAPQGRQLVSVGRPLPGYGVRIVDDKGAPLPEGRLGRVLVSGPSLMEGYHGSAEATAEVLRGDWLDTGDTGFFHTGHLFLHGRGKDLIIVRGRNYPPEDIEQSLYEVPGLRRGCWAAVGVVREDGDGEELFVLVERRRHAKKAGDPQLAEAVSKKVAERTGLIPGKVIVLDPGALPRTSSGKIRRRRCRESLTGLP